MSAALRCRSLADQILDCFPSGTYALSGLLRLLDIVESRDIATAAVECRVQPRLLMNPDFIAAQAETPEKLMMLVMHELHHVLLGHTTLFRRLTPVDNFVFDAVINGLICRMFPEPAYTALLTDYYDDALFPHCLLRPPPGWSPRTTNRHGVASGIQALPSRRRQRAADLHEALYSASGASYKEVFDALPRVVTLRGVSKVALLGDHRQDGSGSADGHLEARAPMLLDAVRDLVERWPQPPSPLHGRSLADLIQTRSQRVVSVPAYRAQLRRLIHRIATAQSGSGYRTGLTSMNVESAVPSGQRRTLVLQSLGQQPLLHPTNVPFLQQRSASDRVHIYVDVSGSMDRWIPHLYGAVLDCRELIHPTVHLFSTKVVDVCLRELKGAVVHSTGGTEIDCVIRHMAEHRVSRAVLLTDGATGKPSSEGAGVLTRIRIGIALTSTDPTYNDLAGYADHTVVLTENPHV
jgi:VWA domain containing CoxE-like protein